MLHFILRRKLWVFLALVLFFTKTKSQTFYSKSTGNLNVTSTWGPNTDGSGASPANFTAAGRLYIITNTSAATIGGAWAVSGLGSKVQLGDGITGVEFIVPAAFAFTGVIDVMNTGTLNLQNTTNPTFGIISSGSNVTYAANAAQTVLNAAYYDLVLAGTSLKTLANTISTSISNSLVINTGVTFRLNTANTLSVTITGSVSGSGSFVGNANANLVINGTGNLGTLRFVTTLSLYQFIINRTSSGVVTMGSNLTVTNAFIHTNGNINLNGNLLTLNNAITFPAAVSNGQFIGSSTSSITIGASATTITNPFFIDQTNSATRTLSRFSISRTGQNFILGNDLIVQNNFVHTNGIIDLNGKSLSVGGIITFPVAITNGYFIGSTTSSLTVGGTGVITNNLKLDQTNAGTRSLNFFTVDHSGGTLTFGNDIICTNTFIHNNGPISIGTSLFTLNGDITFPVSATNGSLTGSSTSSLEITGNGTITNPVFMSQASALARTLNYFSFNRAGETLILGNPLIANAFTQTNGLINLNGTSLTLNGAVVFPAGISNGAFIGSTTSSLSIGVSATTISNPLFLTQTNSNTRSLGLFGLNRTGQTLVLGNDLIVANTFTHTNGIIDLNGKSLSISGVITMPAALTNGNFIGSTTSSLTVGGAGVITNSLKFDQSNAGTRTLNFFTVDHTGGTLPLGTDIICDGPFIHNNGPITLGTTLLTLNNAITFPATASNGSLTGSTTSSILVAGNGSINNFLFMSQASANARTLNSFVFNRTGETIALGNTLVVNAFTQTDGVINLNGTLLSLNGAIVFPSTISNGYFIGSASSSLTIGTSATSITNPLFMDQANVNTKTLAQFTFNRTGQTLVLANDLVVENNFVHTAGVIDLNGTSLSVNDVITFPVAITNGAFNGSTTSSLTIGGTGVVTNGLKFLQTNAGTRSLDIFTVDHSGGTLTLGNNIIVEGTFNHVNGPIAIGATSLTLNGTIVFPVSATNGSLTGSATSSIAIGGAGPITNSLFMSQADAVARTFNNFLFNRSGQTIVMGNSLIVNAYTQTNGLMNLNGNLLTLNGVITFPSSISNGAFIGSPTSSLTIGGTGIITNTLKMDQTNSSNLSLYDLVMNRTGQTLTLGNVLEIRNSITPTLGTIATAGFAKLKSDATRSAMVGTVGGAISGNITVETYAPGPFTGWTNLGPSGVTGLTVANWESQFPMTCIGCPFNEYSTGGYFVSVQGFNEAGVGNAAYLPLSYSSSLTRGVGYWVYLGTGSSATSDITYSVTGPASTGNVVIPITVSNNSGYNLVSNPYPAPLDWDLVTADLSNVLVNGSIYFYNPDLGQSVSYASGVSNPSGYIVNGIIPMSQGFYVQGILATSLTFRETHKSNQNTNSNPLLKPQDITKGDVFRLSILGPNSAYDETSIRLHPNATSNYDRLLDAHKLFQTPGYVGTTPTYSNYTTISSRLNGEDYSINSLPSEGNQTFVLPILAKAQVTGSYVISPIGMEELKDVSCLTLRDNLLNIDHDLRTGPYVCNISDSTSTPRFDLIFCNNLPTDLMEHSSAIDNKVSINKVGSSTIVVKTKFEKEVESVIDAYDISGIKIIQDMKIQGIENEVKLDFSENNNQMVILVVSNEYGRVKKKVYLHP